MNPKGSCIPSPSIHMLLRTPSHNHVPFPYPTLYQLNLTRLNIISITQHSLLSPPLFIRISDPEARTKVAPAYLGTSGGASRAIPKLHTRFICRRGIARRRWRRFQGREGCGREGRLILVQSAEKRTNGRLTTECSLSNLWVFWCGGWLVEEDRGRTVHGNGRGEGRRGEGERGGKGLG